MWNMEYQFSTKCIYGDGSRPDCDQSGAVSFPIYQSATFAHVGVGEVPGRLQQTSEIRPENSWRTWWQL
jgi:cystathionine gamma-synthase